MKKNLFFFLATLVVATMLLLAACGGNPSLGGQQSSATPSLTPSQTPNLIWTVAAQTLVVAQTQTSDLLATMAIATATETPKPPAAPLQPPAATQTPIVVKETVVVEKIVEVVPTVDYTQIFTGSVPNLCPLTNTIQQIVVGETMTSTAGVYWMNSAIGADSCAGSVEGRWFEGFHPGNDHHVTAFFGAGENVSLLNASVWLHPVSATPRDLLYDLAKAKCDNWDNAKETPQPIVFDYVDLSTNQIVHTTPASCADLRASGNTLPDPIGLIPAIELPHFGKGYTWGHASLPAAPAAAAAVAFEGQSAFDKANVGLTCSLNSNVLGDNTWSLIDPTWDKRCIYLIDGEINGQRAIALIRGEDIEKVKGTLDVSIWPVPSHPEWIATTWAVQFASDNCPSELPILIYQDGGWSALETHDCP